MCADVVSAAGEVERSVCLCFRPKMSRLSTTARTVAQSGTTGTAVWWTWLTSTLISPLIVTLVAAAVPLTPTLSGSSRVRRVQATFLQPSQSACYLRAAVHGDRFSATASRSLFFVNRVDRRRFSLFYNYTHLTALLLNTSLRAGSETATKQPKIFYRLKYK